MYRENLDREGNAELDRLLDEDVEPEHVLTMSEKAERVLELGGEIGA